VAITFMTLLSGGMLVLGSLLGVVRPLEPSLWEYGLWVVGMAVTALVYAKAGRSMGWMELARLYVSLFLAPIAMVPPVWLSRNATPTMFQNLADFVWPAGVPFVVRPGVLPMQLGCAALVLLGVLLLVLGLIEGAKAICALGRASERTSN